MDKKRDALEKFLLTPAGKRLYPTEKEKREEREFIRRFPHVKR